MYYEELEKIEDIAKQLINEKYEKGYFKCTASYDQNIDCIKILLNGYNNDDLSQRYYADYNITVSLYENCVDKESCIKSAIEYMMANFYNFK